MKVFEEGVDFPAQKEDANFTCTDFVTLAAKKAFGISYLFPWQRIVIANILDAAKYFMPDSIQQENELIANQGEVECFNAKDFFSDEETSIEDVQNEKDAESEKNFLKKNKVSCNSENFSLSDKASDFSSYGRQIVLLPTGAGKSLCFLTPAAIFNGATLVLYPLLALMADQKRRMDEGGIKSVVFRGGQSAKEREENFNEIKNGAKIILANPEVLQSEALVSRLSKYKIVHIAIDEAHVTSEWGDTFRPAYLTLGTIIKKLNVPVVTAFTATASPLVLARISEILFDGKAHIVRSDSDRPNIHYEVINAYAKKRAAFKLAVEREKPLIIFCGTRKKSEDMSRELALYFGEDKVKFYHAGLEKEEKTEIEKWFYPKTDAILCCTCAFGMGVDKKDIHTVIHLEASPTAESYIQEAGRGGRDGSVANAILLWSKNDSEKYSKFPKGSRERVLADFAESSSCRRQILLDALGGEKAACDGCDVCKRKGPAPYAKDAAFALKYISHHKNFFSEEKLTSNLEEKFNGRDLKKMKINIWEHSDIEEILYQLKIDKKIHKGFFLFKNKISSGPQKDSVLKTKIKIITKKTNFWLKKYCFLK